MGVLVCLLITTLFCISCTKPIGEDPLAGKVSDPPSTFDIATLQNLESNLIISWSKSENADSYDVSYGTSSGNYTETLANSNSPLSLNDLVHGTTYYFMVKAKNTLGEKNASTEKSLTYQRLPASFTLTTAAAGNGSVTLSWNSSTYASSYLIKYGTTAGTYTTTISSSPTSPYLISGLTAGTPYYFTVIAQNGAGSTNASNELSATPVDLNPIAPSTPTGLAATAGTGSCSLSWTASATGSPTIKYTVKRGASPAAASSGTTVCNQITGTSCNDTGLGLGSTYYYALVASNTAGESAWTSSVSCELMALPGSFSLNSTTIGYQKVTLTWGSSSAATSYTVKYGTSSGSYTNTASSNATSPFVVTGLTNGTTYYFQVIATNTSGNTNSTNELTGIPVNTAPSIALTGSAMALGAATQHAFTISDPDPENVLSCTTSVSASSGNTSIIPNANISFSGSAPNCLVTLNPQVGARGNTTLTFTVTDGDKSANGNLTFDVLPLASRIYSTKKRISSYSGSALRLRRSSDSAEQNIGFDVNGNLDSLAVNAFLGATQGFVTTWYDQSSSGLNATQATTNSQPELALVSGEYRLLGNGTSNSMVATGITSTAQMSVHMKVRLATGYSTAAAAFSHRSSSRGMALYCHTDNKWQGWTTRASNTWEKTIATASASASVDMNLSMAINSSTTSRKLYTNGTLTSGTLTTYLGPTGTSLYLFAGANGTTERFKGYIKEFNFFAAELTASEVAVLAAH